MRSIKRRRTPVGSWNETCGITHLPIYEDDPVVVFFLEKSSEKVAPGGVCHPVSVWAPFGLPVSGRYADYGNVEDVVKDWNTDLLLKTLYSGCIHAKLAAPAVDPDDDDLHPNMREITEDDFVSIEAAAKASERGRLFDRRA